LNQFRLNGQVRHFESLSAEDRIQQNANKVRTDEILSALKANEFKVYYQPIVELKSNRVLGFECLMRWHHPQKGVLLPASFIPFVEQSEMIVEFTKFVIHSAAQQVTSWKKMFPERLPTLTVNLSWNYSKYSNLLTDVKNILDKFDEFVPQFLCFELMETAAAQDGTNVVEIIQELRKLGISISIDDFGTGYSCLSYLGELPATSVKIDRVFVQKMLEQHRGNILIRSIINMAQELGLKVVAEGIETTEQLENLLSLGCEFGQGFLFAKALLPFEAQKMIHSQTTFKNEVQVYKNFDLSFFRPTSLVKV
jgi:EAL domain-containing protein (putative c-di-GMP-specific phosphodiesterase class I)